MIRNNTGKVIAALIIIILMLLGVVLYTLVLKPTFNGYVVKKQIEARDVVLNSILLQLQQQGFVRIVDNNGIAVVLAPVPQSQQTQPQA